jgi:hypothetical protein
MRPWNANGDGDAKIEWKRQTTMLTFFLAARQMIGAWLT